MILGERRCKSWARISNGECPKVKLIEYLGLLVVLERCVMYQRTKTRTSPEETAQVYAKSEDFRLGQSRNCAVGLLSIVV